MDIEVDHIREVQWNKQAFENLAIDKKTKNVVRALVSKQIATDMSTDLISGKGNGLIMLLHGGPGTGKTLTAGRLFLLCIMYSRKILTGRQNRKHSQNSPDSPDSPDNSVDSYLTLVSVAELVEKPLYRVTCGDIGTTPGDVEKVWPSADIYPRYKPNIPSILRPFFALAKSGAAVSISCLLSIFASYRMTNPIHSRALGRGRRLPRGTHSHRSQPKRARLG